MTPIVLITSALGLLVGGAGGFVGHMVRSKKMVKGSEQKRDEMLAKVREETQTILADARKEAAEVKSHESEEMLVQNERVKRLEDRIRGKETLIERRVQTARKKKENVAEIERSIWSVREEISAARQREIEGLSKSCGVPVDHAMEIMLTQINDELERDKLDRLHRLDSILEEEAEEQARSILLSTIQRYSLPTSHESSAMMIDISKRRQRDKLLYEGSENIQKLQELTGVECEIDEETGVLLIHSNDLLKRSIAKMALMQTMKKKRRVIPRDLEEAIQTISRRAYITMDELGKKTITDLGIQGIDPRMTRLVGRLAYRTSFGQNILLHVTEVSFLSALLAGELGADVKLCKRAGLVHDIGKGVDVDVEGPHDVLSRDIAVKLNFDPAAVHVAYAHHEQVEYDTPEDRLIQVADAISASRPGARQEATEQYIERIQALELLASSFPGVSKAYAIQAGREIRVIVEPEEVSDEQATQLAKEIAAKVTEQLTFPGEIMVHVIRETTVSEYAR